MEIPSKIEVQLLRDDILRQKDITLSVARLDKLHPIVSGNKLFKLHYFLQEAKAKKITKIITFGGPYSNHLVATAFACKELGINCIGIVRGEKSNFLNHTLQSCINYEMKLKFSDRQTFEIQKINAITGHLINEITSEMIIPEGGYHPWGTKGASEIMKIINNDSYTHVCTAIGTATTLAGIIESAKPNQQIIGINVLKGMIDIPERLNFLLKKRHHDNLQIVDEYHFGGYAKKDDTLISFMNDLYKINKLETDFVYTGKVMFGIIAMIKKGYFPKGSKILCLHTGGLQGNLSLLPHTLVY